ncbi:MAG: type II toxin-antitoxin system PemK/MazF family toxin [Nitrososphaerota archaeon]|jgi:mRNA interferase MazF|nr:type II toxin-antitoxin system PemK/MazF family toxin [Nitrososphaerota archaeon]
MVEVNQGDIVWVDFSPQAGHEQKGRRPALIVSNSYINKITRFRNVMLCPITNTQKKFPFHVDLDDRVETTGTIMCEQVKMLDANARNVKFIEKLPQDLLIQVLGMIKGFADLDENLNNCT